MIIDNICLNVTFVCNENCIYCFRDNGVSMDLKSSEALIKALKQLNVKKVNLTGGEPTLFPYLKELIYILKNSGFKISITTNATQFLPFLLENLDWISFSLDSLNPETLKKLGRNPILLENLNKYFNYIRENQLTVKVKINSVFTSKNSTKDNLIELAKFINKNADIVKRWKLFKFLSIRRAKNKKMLEIDEEIFKQIVILAKKISQAKISLGTKPHYTVNYNGNGFDLFMSTEKGDILIGKISLEGKILYSSNNLFNN